MQRTLGICCLLVASLISSCIPPQLTAELTALRKEIQETRTSQDALRGQLDSLENRFEIEIRWIWSERLCKSGKVAEFVGQLQAGIPEVCTASSLETSLFFMNNQPYAITYLRPRDGLLGLHPARLGRLKEILDPRSIHRSTRVVVMAQPHDESREAAQKTLQVAEAFVSMVRDDIIKQKKVPVLGPFLLPCRMTNEVKRTYNKSLDRPLLGEPDDKEPRIRIWLYVTDC